MLLDVFFFFLNDGLNALHNGIELDLYGVSIDKFWRLNYKGYLNPTKLAAVTLLWFVAPLGITLSVVFLKKFIADFTEAHILLTLRSTAARKPTEGNCEASPEL